jgi:hypothetical protein
MGNNTNTVNIMVLAPAFGLCILLVLNNARGLGAMNALLFVLVGLPFFWKRELWAQEEVMFDFQQGAIMFFHVRLVGIVGWFFTSYCSLAVAEDIIRKFFPRQENRVFITAALTVPVSLAIATIVETAAQNMGWWTANDEGMRAFPIFFHGAYWFAPAWASTVIFFLLPYLMSCSLFKAASKKAAAKKEAVQIKLKLSLIFVFFWMLIKRVTTQFVLNYAVVIVFVIFFIRIGALATFVIPLLSAVLACLPFSSRMKYL